MAKIEGQQNSVMPEGTNRVIGKDAQRINIAIGYAVANLIRTTLGPKGMDKMLVSDLGDVTITNDGATILQEMNVDHPIAKILVDIAKTQDKEVGDGTTTAVMLTGMLLKNSGDLLDQNIHASTIIKGYELASKKAEELLKQYAVDVDVKDTEKLQGIAAISMGSKSVGEENGKEHLAKIVADAVEQVSEEDDNKIIIDNELIKIEKKVGGKVSDTELIKGVLVDKEVVHAGMPKKIDGAKIALIDTALEIEKTEVDAKIEITSPDQLEKFLAQEEKMLKDMVEKIKATGANVLFCQKGIDDMAQHYLAKEKILAVRRVKKSDMEKLSRATGAKIASSLHDLKAEDLGQAGLVEERKISGNSMVFVEQCKDPKSVTIFVRGGTEHIVNEVERAIVDAIGAVSSVVEDGKVVTGGGSIEMKVSTGLKEYAKKIGGREQLAINAFAEALEIIPKTLAENAGMDAIDVLVELRASDENTMKGVDVNAGKVSDMNEIKVYEPLRVKKQAISSATEATRMILRIDDMISARPKPPSQGGAGAGAGMNMGY